MGEKRALRGHSSPWGRPCEDAACSCTAENGNWAGDDDSRSCDKGRDKIAVIIVVIIVVIFLFKKTRATDGRRQTKGN